MKRRVWLGGLGACILFTAALALVSWTRKPDGAQAAAAPFTNVAAEVGIRFEPGLPAGRLSIRDIAGSGGGFLDYDRDGDVDIVLLGWDHCALYRNDGGRFTDVTTGSGLPQKGQWIGCAAADYDNDGFPDLFLNGYGCVALLRNRRGSGFADVTKAAELQPPGGPVLYGTGAAWGDVDGDGWLDLYVARYLHFEKGMQEFCRARSGAMETCNPDHYRAQIGALYRSVKGRRFRDVTRQMGAGNVHGKTWGALFFDFDDDGWQDLYLANDEVPGDLLHNQDGKRFRNVGIEAGVAYDADGRPHGAMGADAGDYDGDGRLDLVVTTFYNEAYSLYRNNGDQTFTDRASLAGIGIPTIPNVGWGTGLFDYDLDGWLDILFVNGHATDSDSYPNGRDGMRQSMQLFRNAGGHFEPVRLGPLEKPLLGRGAAFGDYDNDGDTDVLVTDSGGPALLLRNDTAGPGRHWLGLELTGTRRNRDAAGALVTVKAGDRVQVAEVRTSGGLYSSHDPRLRFGLGPAVTAGSVEIRWPGGRITRLANAGAGSYVKVRE